MTKQNTAVFVYLDNLSNFVWNLRRYNYHDIHNRRRRKNIQLSDVEPVDASAGPGGALQSKINAKKEAAKEAIGKGVNKALDAFKNKKKDKK